jgi:hypothetical protein
MPYVCIFLLIMLSRLHWIDIGHFSYLATQVYLMKLTTHLSFLVVSDLSSPKPDNSCVTFQNQYLFPRIALLLVMVTASMHLVM